MLFKKNTYILCLISLFIYSVIVLVPDLAMAAFGEDLEKPKPTFQKENQSIIAKLIPRGKSTFITIDFTIKGATLQEVKAYDFDFDKSNEVDKKDFRSSLFQVTITNGSPSNISFGPFSLPLPRTNAPIASPVSVSLTSSYFSSATQLWIYNPKSGTPWMNAQAQSIDLKPKRAIEVSVKDGGPMDCDGMENGQITLICGPKDSFWGYAIGTLFIRFFGVFLVLLILEIGMLLSGKVFQYLESKKSEMVIKEKEEDQVSSSVSVPTSTDDDELIAAAISTALHVHLSLQKIKTYDFQGVNTQATSSWALQGRIKQMNDRMILFKR
ncbi:MAG: OadG family protein [Desulfobacterales bacterium]|nr:OadG family protein [Desulfobacterales bacterium]